MEPSAHPLSDRRSRGDRRRHADGGLPHGHATHPATKVRVLNARRSEANMCGIRRVRKPACSYFMDTLRLFYGLFCVVAFNQTLRSTGRLMSLLQIAAPEFTISIKFESSNIETLKLGLNKPVGIYPLSVSVWGGGGRAGESMCQEL